MRNTKHPTLYLLALLLVSTQAAAEITTDGSVGAATNVDLIDNTYTIPQSLGTTSGNNLFHSFSQFNVETNTTADFTGSTNIQNIFSRVTGGNPSNIDGTLRSSIQGANLYLMNPYGIIFGPNATLDITGSFYATTADSLLFEDGLEYNGRETTLPLAFSVVPVEAFGFSSNEPASIYSNGAKLHLNSDKTLGLVGGEINLSTNPDDFFDGTRISTQGGQVQMLSAKSPGQIKADVDQINLDEDLDAYGDISFYETSVDVSGEIAGRVVIRGGNLTMDSFSEITAESYGETDATNNYPSTIDVAVTDSINMDFFSRLSTEVAPFALTDTKGIMLKAKHINLRDSDIQTSAQIFSEGKSGDIVLEAETITSSGSNITSQTRGFEAASAIQLNATESISLESSNISTTTHSDFNNSGDIRITTKELSANDNSEIMTLTRADGNSGNITVDATSVNLDEHTNIVTESRSSGDAGNISLNSESMQLLDGARIASGASSTGRTGNLDIKADEILIRGPQTSDDPFISDFTGMFTSVSNAEGGGGNIDITSQKLTLDDRGKIAVINIETGNSGELNINSGTIDVLSGSVITTESVGATEGNGGDLIIEADTINVVGFHDDPNYDEQGELNDFDRSEISSVGTEIRNAPGKIGDIHITSKDLNILNGAAIVSSSEVSTSGTGSIFINTENLKVSGVNSMRVDAFLENNMAETEERAIRNSSSNVQATNRLTITPDNEVTIGIIDVHATNVVLDDGGFISSETRGTLDSNTINIDANAVQIRNGGYITATNAQALAIETTGGGGTGNINIETDNLLIDGNNSRFVSSGIYTSTGRNIANEGGIISLAVKKEIKLVNNAIISSELNSLGNGGNIKISSESIQLVNDATITARATENSEGNAGNIIIDSNLLTLNSGNIFTTAKTGNGGDITINTNNIIKTADSVISAASDESIDGTININTQTEVISNLEQFQETPPDATTFLHNACIQSETQSRLLVSQPETLAHTNLSPSYYTVDQHIHTKSKPRTSSNISNNNISTFPLVVFSSQPCQSY